MSHPRVAFSTMAISSGCALIKAGDRVIDRFQARSGLIRRLVAANSGFEVEMPDNRIKHDIRGEGVARHG